MAEIEHRNLSGDSLHDNKAHNAQSHTDISVTGAQIGTAVAKTHDRSHAVNSTSDHSEMSGDVGDLVVLDANKRPAGSGMNTADFVSVEALEDFLTEDEIEALLEGKENAIHKQGADPADDEYIELAEGDLWIDTSSAPYAIFMWDGEYWVQVGATPTLDEVGDPQANKVFSMGGNIIEWLFTNPVGGMLLRMTGGWAGHVFEILDTASAGQGAAGDHLVHIETNRSNVLPFHVVASPGTRAMLVEGSLDMDGNDIVNAGNLVEEDDLWDDDTTADAGSALEIDWNDGLTQYITLTEDCDITFANARKNAVLTVLFTGDFEITLPAGTYGIDDEIPLLGDKSIMTVFYDGDGYIVIISPLYEIIGEES